MKSAAAHAITTHAQPRLDTLYMEPTILRVLGALFCHDAKAAGTRTGAIDLPQSAKQNALHIELHPAYGQPGPLSAKVMLALLRKHSSYGLPVRREVSFNQEELARLIGRRHFGGRDSKELAQAMFTVQSAFITAHFRTSSGSYVEERFNLLPRIVIERDNHRQGPIKNCSITLPDPMIHSLEAQHFACLNPIVIEQLSSLGIALYIRLFYHFANLYETSASRQSLVFRKHYGDICAEWLGGLKQMAHRSHIVDKQLGNPLADLVRLEFIAEYSIDKSRTRDGFVVRFRPGAAFFRDYDRFYRHRRRPETPSEYHSDRLATHEPHSIAQLWLAKRHNIAVASVTDVLTGDVETARTLIAQLGFANVAPFIDFALERARTTNYDVERLAGLRQYLVPFKARLAELTRAQSQRTSKVAADAQAARARAYEAWIDSEVERATSTLSPEVLAEIEARADRSLAANAIARASRLARIRRDLIAVRLRLPDLEHWTPN